MIQEKQLKQIAPVLQHIFCLKIGRITFREVENAVFQALQGNATYAHALIKMFLTGQIQQEIVEQDALPLLRNMLSAFSAPIRVAHDVHEQGDFLFTATAEIVVPAANGQQPLFLHRTRRVDGKESDFLCDLPRTMHMMRHFFMRFEELLEHEEGPSSLQSVAPDLQVIQERIGNLLNQISSKVEV